MVCYTLIALALQVAITIDDVPRGGDSTQRDLPAVRAMTAKLLRALEGIPVTAFVNAGGEKDVGAEGLQQILRMWRDVGAELGNHTYSHPDLNRVPLDQYTADIVRGEPAIEKASGRKPRYFRHPFLRTGKDQETKRGLEAFLESRGYVAAPVTIDNSDWMFAAVYASGAPDAAARVRKEYVPYMDSQFAFFEMRTREVVGRDIAQVLLIHANQLNADMLPDLLAMMRRRGYEFVSLDEALRDEAYKLPNEYAGPGGFSWIHRWSRTKGMPPKGEPDEPDWLVPEHQKLQKR